MAPDNQDIDPEYIDQSVWVPKGDEVVPAALLLNGHVRAQGKGFIASEASLIDRLLYAERIDPSHHEIALRLIKLFRSGTSKQDYSMMRIFATSRGYDNSDFCPMTTFIRVTRTLKPSQFQWIRILCGLRHCGYIQASENADLIKDALEAADKNLGDLPRQGECEED